MIRLTRKGVRRWHGGHPWIFRSDVAQLPEGVSQGAIASVGTHQGRRLGRAAWSDHAQLCLRRMPVAADEPDLDGWLRLLHAAIARRDLDHPCARLVNGDADGLPGLVVDRFGPGLGLQMTTQAAERFKAPTIAALSDLLSPAVVVLRNDTRTRAYEGLEAEKRLVVGDQSQVEVEVDALRWVYDLMEGQKTGGYLDQLENQRATARLASGEGLDCCSYEGGFALRMARAGCAVTALDSSAPALARLRGHAQRNQLSVDTVEENVFDALRTYDREGRRFDTVVLDPPPFARSRKALPAARRAYKELNLRALKILRPGGLLVTCSCSAHVSGVDFERIVADAAADAKRWARVVDRRGAPADHPTLLLAPETDYLKALFIEVD